MQCADILACNWPDQLSADLTTLVCQIKPSISPTPVESIVALSAGYCERYPVRHCTLVMDAHSHWAYCYYNFCDLHSHLLICTLGHKFGKVDQWRVSLKKMNRVKMVWGLLLFTELHLVPKYAMSRTLDCTEILEGNLFPRIRLVP